MGHWAAEWTFGDPEDEDCDGLSLMWRLHQHAITAKLPRQRTVLQSGSTTSKAALGPSAGMVGGVRLAAVASPPADRCGPMRAGGGGALAPWGQGGRH
jgi:hypothetical protein